MTLQRTPSTHPGRAALSLRWLVVLLILFGTFVMPIGNTVSHGMAAVTQTLHASASLTGTQHDHDHAQDYEHASPHQAGESSFVTPADGSMSEHAHHGAHHGADHSHDPAHTPVAAWGPIPPQLVRWVRQPLLWVETVQQSRLERPPIG